MHKLNAGVVLVGFIGMAAAVAPVMADVNIPVVNPSFETIGPTGLTFGCAGTCAYSDAGTTPIVGWSTTSGAGQFQPGGPSEAANPYFLILPDGPTSAYSNSPMITQTVGATVQSGVTYTLSVDIGARLDLPALGTAGLFVGNTLYQAGGTPIVQGSGLWYTETATFTGSQSTLGDAITIELNTGGAQGNYDNVVLTATPEPGLYAVLSFAFCGLFIASRKRRQRKLI